MKISVPKRPPNENRSEGTEPPVVLPPDGVEDPFQFGTRQGSSFLDYEIPEKKKKVSVVLPTK